MKLFLLLSSIIVIWTVSLIDGQTPSLNISTNAPTNPVNNLTASCPCNKFNAANVCTCLVPTVPPSNPSNNLTASKIVCPCQIFNADKSCSCLTSTTTTTTTIAPSTTTEAFEINAPPTRPSSQR